MLKIAIVLGTRPEFLKLYPVARAVEKHGRGVRGLVINTAQHRTMVDELLRKFPLEIFADLDLMSANQTTLDVIQSAMSGLKGLFEKERPDWVVVQGDTTTAMTAALVAFQMRIPVAHVEAGLRSYDLDHPFPEESNRRIISATARLHFAPTEGSRQNLLKEGIVSEDVPVVGNTVVDQLQIALAREHDFEDPSLRSIPRDGDWILVTAHRRENHGPALRNICEAIKRVAAEHPGVRLVYPVHPNPNVRNVVDGTLAGVPRVHLVEPVGYLDMVYLMRRSRLILTDSGGVQEEAPTLGKPVLILRTVTERPEAVSCGCARLVGTETDDVVREVGLLMDEKEYPRRLRMTNPFGDGHASERIVEEIVRRSGGRL